jgi:type I restriction-modification system DNA methylase subunit
MISKRHRELTDEEILKIAGNTYHEWRKQNGIYKDIKGFCKSASIADIRQHRYALVPGRYAGCVPITLEPMKASEINQFKQISKDRFDDLKQYEQSFVRILELLK